MNVVKEEMNNERHEAHERERIRYSPSIFFRVVSSFSWSEIRTTKGTKHTKREDPLFLSCLLSCSFVSFVVGELNHERHEEHEKKKIL